MLVDAPALPPLVTVPAPPSAGPEPPLLCVDVERLVPLPALQPTNAHSAALASSEQ
jgi:hypothetical protein